MDEKCGFCHDYSWIVSDEGIASLKLLDNTGKVEMAPGGISMKFNYCPMCGRCFG